jgi:hypothetical protein
LKIPVLVYNYAQVPQATLARAEEQAKAIFRKAGLETQWWDHFRSKAEFRNDQAGRHEADRFLVVVRLLPKPRAVLRSSTLGEALTCEPGAEMCIAQVFLDRVIGRTAIGEISLEQVLGHAMAHEVGHLLLGSNSHWTRGLMRGKWSLEDLRRAAKGDLLFTPQQAEVIRAEVLRRVRQQEARQAGGPVAPISRR